VARLSPRIISTVGAGAAGMASIVTGPVTFLADAIRVAGAGAGPFTAPRSPVPVAPVESAARMMTISTRPLPI